MKTNILSLLAIAGLISFAGCANDDTANKQTEQEPGTEGLTSFVEEDNTTRTTGEYDGSGLNFYWTEGDRLWVNAGTATSPVLKQDSKNNISDLLVANPATPAGVKRAAKASFAFAGTYTALSYPVRYTGKNNVSGGQVSIKSEQSQNTPNDASHIGESGDCGTATAFKNGNKYKFTLSHKASYLTFIPYTTQDVLSNVTIVQIKVTANRTIAGVFEFDDNGINISTPISSYKSITLKLKNGYTDGFPIPSISTPVTNAATLVLAPGTYGKFTIEYMLYDPITHIRGTITKDYTNVTFIAGKNKKVATNLQVPVYTTTEYYMWDAAVGQHYWAGHESEQPGGYPKTSTDSRWYNDIAFPNAASRSCVNCPNANEIFWYYQFGDPHWDENTLWAYGGHLYSGGLWLKKQSVIATKNGKTISDLKSAAPNGIDYTTTPTGFSERPISLNRPSNAADYFYLPALGYYRYGSLQQLGHMAFYWSSSTSSSTPYACNLAASNGGITLLYPEYRTDGKPIWSADASDYQQP